MLTQSDQRWISGQSDVTNIGQTNDNKPNQTTLKTGGHHFSVAAYFTVYEPM